MATYAVQEAAITGVVPTRNAVASADKFANDGRITLHVVNGSGGSINVTIDSNAVATSGLAQADQVVAVAAGAEKVIGPFPVGVWNDANGFVNVAYSATTTVTAAVIRTP